jgi:hypothetical protein
MSSSGSELRLVPTLTINVPLVYNNGNYIVCLGHVVQWLGAQASSYNKY